MTAFTNMINDLTTQFDLDERFRPKITMDEYLEFDKYFVMYALADKRYGQAFVEHFNLPDATPLYHFKDREISREWILGNYVK